MQMRCLALCLMLVGAQLSAQTALIDRTPDPKLTNSGVVGAFFDDQVPNAVSPLTVMTLSEPQTIRSVTIYTTNLFGDYPVGSSGPAILNIFTGSTLSIFDDTLSGGNFGDASATANYVAVSTGIEITIDNLEIDLNAGDFLIGITPSLNFAANSQEFIQDAGSAGDTTFLNNPGGELFVPLFGDLTINANIIELPTPFTGMAIRVAVDLDVILGDVNGDGNIDLLDVAPFIEAVETGTYIPAADTNSDGVVNLLDVAPFIDLLLG